MRLSATKKKNIYLFLFPEKICLKNMFDMFNNMLKYNTFKYVFHVFNMFKNMFNMFKIKNTFKYLFFSFSLPEKIFL